MKQTLILKGSLPGMNEIIAMAHSPKYAKVKADLNELIAWECKAQKLQPFKKQINITVTWICKDKHRDKDNIAAGFKFIGDGLQHGGVIKNDGWDEIGDTTNKYEIGTPKIIINMEENT